MYALYDSNADAQEDDQEDDDDTGEADTESQTPERPIEHARKEADNQEQAKSETKYYAQLVGFGSAEAAYNFTRKLARKNIDLLVKKNTGRTARGTVRSWYQVITKKYDKKEQLVALIDVLKKEERLKDVRIIPC